MTAREVSLGPPVIAYLEAEGWDVYQEVQPSGGAVADIVAVSGRLVRVVELKMHLSWELLDQAIRWGWCAHQVFVAVPYAKPSDGRRMARRVFASHGIGILEIRPPSGMTRLVGSEGARIAQIERAAFNRKAQADKIRGRLRPEHKTHSQAGSARGGHWTEFKAMCDELRKYVDTHPGATIVEVVKDVKHHYASDAGARARIVDLIERGVIKGVRVERDGKTKRLFAA